MLAELVSMCSPTIIFHSFWVAASSQLSLVECKELKMIFYGGVWCQLPRRADAIVQRLLVV